MSKVAKGDYVSKNWVKTKVTEMTSLLERQHKEAMKAKNELIRKQQEENQALAQTNQMCRDKSLVLSRQNDQLSLQLKQTEQQVEDLLKTIQQNQSKNQVTITDLQSKIEALTAKVHNLDQQLSEQKGANQRNMKQLVAEKEAVRQLEASLQQKEKDVVAERDLRTVAEAKRRKIAEQRDLLIAQFLKQKEEYQSKIESLERSNKSFSMQEQMSRISRTSSVKVSDNSVIQIEELFRRYPHDILNFMDSLPGDEPEDPVEMGDMTCMLISKDGLSIEKYIKINRSFLKMKIKKEEKRFRFVLIHKPDKIERPKKMQKKWQGEKIEAKQ